MRLPASVYPRLAGGVSYPVGSVVDNECKRLRVSLIIDNTALVLVCLFVRVSAGTRATLCLQFQSLSDCHLSAASYLRRHLFQLQRVSLSLYFIDAFHILPTTHSVTGYVLLLSNKSNSAFVSLPFLVSVWLPSAILCRCNAAPGYSLFPRLFYFSSTKLMLLFEITKYFSNYFDIYN